MRRQVLISGILIVLLMLISPSWAKSNAPSRDDAQRQYDYWNQKFREARDARAGTLDRVEKLKSSAAEISRQADRATGETRKDLRDKAYQTRQEADWELQRSAVHREEMDKAERQLDLWDEYLREGTLSEEMTYSDGRSVVTSTESSPPTTSTTGGVVPLENLMGLGDAPKD